LSLAFGESPGLEGRGPQLGLLERDGRPRGSRVCRIHDPLWVARGLAGASASRPCQVCATVVPVTRRHAPENLAHRCVSEWKRGLSPADCGSGPAADGYEVNNVKGLYDGSPVALWEEHGAPQLFSCSFGSRAVLRHARDTASGRAPPTGSMLDSASQLLN